MSLDGLEGAYGAVLAVMPHPASRFPDTAMSVTIEEPLPCTAVAVDIQQLRTTRFEEAKPHGSVTPATMERVDQSLRAVLDL
jgi:mRNA interferase MazF